MAEHIVTRNIQETQESMTEIVIRGNPSGAAPESRSIYIEEL